MTYTERFEEALLFAARLHKQQTRKGSNVPYITHLLAVCSLVGEYGGNENQAIAALLHDAVEDQGGKPTLLKIQEFFGNEVAFLVEGCTDSDILPKPPWRERKEAYLKHLRLAPAEIRLVSAADKLHNARTVLMDLRALGDDVWSRFTAGKAGSLWYYRELVSALGSNWSHPILDELDRTVSVMEELAKKELSLSKAHG